MAYLAVGAIGLVLLLLLARLFVDAKPGQVRQAIIWGGALLGVVLVGVLVVSGRAMQAIWALALFGPAVWRWWQGFRAARSFARGGKAAPGQASDVETSHLALALDHDTGRMTGRVKAGRFAGRDLADLDLPALLALMAELAADDPDGVPLLEAWMDRAHPDWREAAGPPPGAGARDGPMTRADALAVLGLDDGAT